MYAIWLDRKVRFEDPYLNNFCVNIMLQAQNKQMNEWINQKLFEFLFLFKQESSFLPPPAPGIKLMQK